MEKSYKLIFCSLILFTGCMQEPDVLPDFEGDLSSKEALLAQTWRYKDVLINNPRSGSSKTFNSVMELDGFNSRSIINKRKINYNQAGSYQLQWDNRGEYELGTKGDPNWQPNIGYWSIEGEELIHNKGQGFETRYELEVGQYSMTRTHTRYMSEWDNYAHFVERFISEENFKAGDANDVPLEVTSFSDEKGTFTLNWKRPDISDLNGFDFAIFESGNTTDTLLKSEENFGARDNVSVFGFFDEIDLEVHLWSRFDNGNTSEKVIITFGTNPFPPPPENLAAASLINSVLLEWNIPETNVIKGFKLVYEPQGLDTLDLGLVSAHTITNLDPEFTYTFSLFSYDENNCLSDRAFITATPGSADPRSIPFVETFSTCANDWTVVSDGAKNWECGNSNEFPYHGNGFGVQDASSTNELWLISPLIDPGIESAVLSFEYLSFGTDAAGFGLEVRVLSNYGGSGIPEDRGVILSAGINNELNEPEFALSNYSIIPESNPFHLAFLSTNSVGNTAIISAVDNIRVEYAIEYSLPYFEDFNKEYIVEQTNWTRFSFGNEEDHWRNIGIGASGADEDFAALMNSFNHDDTPDTPGDDWLISPGIDVGSAASMLSFDYATNFNDEDVTKGVKVFISTSYEQWSDPTLANWEELDFISEATNTASGSPIYQTKTYDLSGYTDQIHIAFHYTSSGSEANKSILFRVDNFRIE